jgi:phasin
MEKPDMDQSTQASARAKSRAATASTTPTFEFPKFGMPNFEVPKMEIPAAYREFAEKSVSQAKATYEQMKSVADEATDALDGAYATMSKGVADCGHKVIEAARVNTNANFDYATQLMAVKTFSEIVELSTAHARKQFETFTTQTRDFAALAQKVAAETTEPVKDCFTKTISRKS